MFQVQKQELTKKPSVIKSNLLNTTMIDINPLVKCIQAEQSTQKNREGIKSRGSRGYYQSKYQPIETGTKIRLNELSHKQIFIPGQIQVQANIINVSFGVMKRKKIKSSLYDKTSRPQTSSSVRRSVEKPGHSLSQPPRSRQNKYDVIFYPSKIQAVHFTNEQIATLNQTFTLNNNKQSSIHRIQQVLKASGNQHQASAPLQNKNQKDQFFIKRKLVNRKDHFRFSLEGKRNTSQNKVELYRDFLWKINYSNGLYLDAEIQIKKPYKVYIGGGNNSSLVKNLFKRRFWWAIVNKMSEDVNFVWTQLKIVSIFDNQRKMTNNQSENLTVDKKNLTISTIQTNFLVSKDIKSLHTAKHAKIFKGDDLILWNQHFKKNTKSQITISDKTYSKRIELMRKKPIKTLTSSNDLLTHNHFQSNSFIGNKKAMFYNLRLYYSLMKQDVFQNIPLTFHIIKGSQDQQFKKFMQIYNSLQKQRCKIGNSFRNIWIMKPGEFTNRGKGITVCSSLQDIVARLKGKEKNADGSTRTFILQKYLQKPFLYYKRKFDIRHYMMMTSVNGCIKGYWYEQGYIRTTSSEYNIKNCKNNFIHLTNDAVQKNSEDYGRYEKGNKLSYQQFQRYLDNFYGNMNFFDTVIPQMKRIATDAIKASYSLLDVDRLNNNFEVFGLDFMIDQDFKTYLIQINTNPCLELSSPLLAKIIPSMVSNSLMIGLDPLFPPPYNWPSNKKFQLIENPIQTNKFQLVFDENVDGPELISLYSDIKKIDERMGNIDDEEQQYPEDDQNQNQQDKI